MFKLLLLFFLIAAVNDNNFLAFCKTMHFFSFKDFFNHFFLCQLFVIYRIFDNEIFLSFLSTTKKSQTHTHQEEDDEDEKKKMIHGKTVFHLFFCFIHFQKRKKNDDDYI